MQQTCQARPPASVSPEFHFRSLRCRCLGTTLALSHNFDGCCSQPCCTLVGLWHRLTQSAFELRQKLYYASSLCCCTTVVCNKRLFDVPAIQRGCSASHSRPLQPGIAARSNTQKPSKRILADWLVEQHLLPSKNLSGRDLQKIHHLTHALGSSKNMGRNKNKEIQTYRKKGKTKERHTERK